MPVYFIVARVSCVAAQTLMLKGKLNLLETLRLCDQLFIVMGIVDCSPIEGFRFFVLFCFCFL